MEVAYDCTVDMCDYEDLTPNEWNKVAVSLNAANYDWRFDISKKKLYICGECRIDPYSMDASDVKAELKWLLYDVAEIDADVYVKEIEYEPDWDRIGGVDDY